MLRMILAAALSGGLVLSSAGAVAASPAAFDFEEPVVPPEFLLHQAPPAFPATVAASDDSTMRLLTQGTAGGARQANGVLDEPTAPVADGAGVSWARDGAPGDVLRVIPGSQWSSGGGGCAIWAWNAC